MEQDKMDDMLRIQCEKILNETWSKALIHYDKIKKIVDRGKINGGSDETILLIAANAALQKMTFDRAIDASLSLNISDEMSPCGRHKKHQCPCDRDICLTKTGIPEI